jgi:hypothetical protein
MKRLIVLLALLAPSGLTWPAGAASDLMPFLLDGKMPVYPSLAKQVRVAGKVRFRVKIVNGLVTDAQLIHTDHPLLVDATLRNILTWRFEASATANVETEFVYELRKEEAASSENPVVELRIPTRVRVVAKPVRPTVNVDPKPDLP